MWDSPNKLMLFFSSVIDILDAPAGIVAIWTYPFGSGFFVKIPDIGRHILAPHRTAPLFINAPVIIPLLWTACARKILYNQKYINYIIALLQNHKFPLYTIYNGKSEYKTIFIQFVMDGCTVHSVHVHCFIRTMSISMFQK